MKVMDSTIALYDKRKEEVLKYFLFLENIDGGKVFIDSHEKSLLVRILKSNLLLMLYNLVEACVVSGIDEIYESIKDQNCSYVMLIDEVRNLWTSNRIEAVYKSNSSQDGYKNAVEKIIRNIIDSKSVCLSTKSSNWGGNLDAQLIKKICDKHRIRYVASDKKGHLSTVKKMRNNLAHGTYSFGDCSRDMTLQDLKEILEQVTEFINNILMGMKTYYDKKLYLQLKVVS